MTVQTYQLLGGFFPALPSGAPFFLVLFLLSPYWLFFLFIALDSFS